MSRGWLIVFAKAPRPGLVKTRLSPPLSLDQAAAFYEVMLEDILEASGRYASELDLLPVLAFHPPDAVPELIGRTPAGFRLHVQRGEDLAERMANAFAEAAAAGASCALLRGSDSPALDRAQLEEALLGLEAGRDVVLTPDRGGGYALIGQRRPCREVFDVAMSTGEVLEQTLAELRALGLDVSLTQSTFDIDQVDDLAFLDSLSPEESSDRCPRTVGMISEWRKSGVL